MGGEPVPDQSSQMETDIILDDNKLGLLWPNLDYCVMKCVQKSNNEGCVVGKEWRGDAVSLLPAPFLRHLSRPAALTLLLPLSAFMFPKLAKRT